MCLDKQQRLRANIKHDDGVVNLLSENIIE